MIDRVYELSNWPDWEMCTVDLSYNATAEPKQEEQNFYALQVSLPCARIHYDELANATVTTLCYNRLKPAFFASITDSGELSANQM